MNAYIAANDDWNRLKRPLADSIVTEIVVISADVREAIEAIRPEYDAVSVTGSRPNTVEGLIDSKAPLIAERNKIMEKPFYFLSRRNRRRINEIDEQLRAIGRQMYRLNNDATEFLDIALAIKSADRTIERCLERLKSVE